jgi:tRNA A37 threonylcarbamoyladenosine dehydratase
VINLGEQVSDDEINDNDDDDDDDAHNLRYTRFGGVGRLYAREISRSDAKIYDDTPKQVVEPHFQIVDRLTASTVSVIGIGGVGSWAAEALVRSGVGNVILMDLDDVCISNTNRQLHATSTSIGKLKTREMKRRLLDINPDCNVTLIRDFVMENNVQHILDVMQPQVDVILDCIDGAKEKTALLAACTQRKIPIVTCGGAAGKVDPTKVVVQDLTRVLYDPLLALCRKNLRQNHGFGKGISFLDQKRHNIRPKKWRIPAVYSTENVSGNEKKAPSSYRLCDGPLGTACFVTGTFGFVAASEVVNMLAKGKLAIPRKDNRNA